MPEICEVVFTSQYLMSKLKNRNLKSITVLSGRYSHSDLPGLYLIEKYSPLIIENIDTKGKFMWFKLKSSKDNTIVYIMNTFGLTGSWGFDKNASTRVEFDIENKDGTKKYKLYYSDQRNFGTIQITTHYDELETKLNSLGSDLLKDKYDEKEFAGRIKKLLESPTKAKTPIVKILQDQTANGGIGSGLGNYLAPEICNKAKLAPTRTLDSLSNDDIKGLYDSIKYILKLCYMNNKIGYMEPFKDLVDKHKEEILNGKYPNYLPEIDIGNDEFKFNVYRQKKDPSGNLVKKSKIIGERTTYWVPAVQK
jgi:formamidopyrimidine-DNA glycosylase